ncbi:multicopper oxidase [Cylindrobasidium torrendii FP15055 ss-10]|uniref:Multicopper oxidase n=1 Tax=Cylindrobasidium torrendii FP15055 ss-10 TaxID=1314674 RepID=A0A0D7B538_9AGAR|nr:multicopper oxidase [Cylindrobasidium torrendii FP15055 ss-10]
MVLLSPSLLVTTVFLGLAATAKFVDVPSDDNGVAYHSLTVSEGAYSPDGGKERSVYFLNDDFGSHIIGIDEGATLKASHLPLGALESLLTISTPFTLHSHGIHQRDSIWMDGVPGVTQKAIMPGETFTYEFKVEQSGMYHMHAHYKALQDDGMYMGLLVRPSADKQKPFAQISPEDQDLIAKAEQNANAVLLADYRRYTSTELQTVWDESNIEPLCANAILFNGQGSAVCPSRAEIDAMAAGGNYSSQGCLWPNDPAVIAFPDVANPDAVPLEIYECDTNAVNSPLYTIEVNKEDGWAVLDFVNAGGLWQLQVSVDEHPLWIFAVDSEYVDVTEPVDSFAVNAGSRFQAAIKLDGQAGDAFNIRAAALTGVQFLSGYAILQYSSADGGNTTQLVSPAEGYPALANSTAYISYTGDSLTTADGLAENATAFNPSGPQAAPFVASVPPSSDAVVDYTFIYDMSRPNATRYAMNATGLHPSMYEDSDPLVWKSVYQPFLDGSATGAVANSHSIEVVDKLNATIDLIISVTYAKSTGHPIHKHLNKFWVIGSGTGLWNWTSVADAVKDIPDSFNFNNPPLRDGFNTPSTFTSDASWLALRYISDTAGPSTLHCHLSQHLGGGMLSVALQDMESLRLPAEFDQPSS